MTYDALTIDTQTVYANGRHLDRGLVGQLDQYKDGLIQVVISEVVLREINSMLVTKAKTSIDALSKTMKEGVGNGQMSEKQAAVLQSVADEMSSPEEHARKQLKAFVTATGAHIVPADKAPMKAILSAYFGKTPPFSNLGKKDEFPDAISLLALETWAKEEKKKILAVSKDGDWKAFSDQSEWIDCIDDLAAAMSKLVSAAEAAEAEARTLLTGIANGTLDALKKTLDGELGRAVELETPYVEFDGPMPGEDEGATLALVDYQISGLDSGDTELTIVRVRADGFVMRIPITVTARAFVDIHFSIYDSIDKDYVPMGSTSVERDIEFDAFALVDCTIHRNAIGEPAQSPEYEIESAQLVGAPNSVDLGYIDYSLADDDHEFNPSEWNTSDDANTIRDG